jgi:predicted NUDIX family NTP pyrophosphohydrolase
MTVDGPFAALGEVRQAGGKIIHAFAVEGDFDAGSIVSGTFQLEWPPRSGRRVDFPEVDRAGWFRLEAAAEKINPAQAELLTRLRAAYDSI